MDYSAGAIELASLLIKDEIKNPSINLNLNLWVGDILAIGSFNDDDSEYNYKLLQKYNLVHDKGTFDAISLSGSPIETIVSQYSASIIRMLENLETSRFIITSCNWTSDELQSMFKTKFIYIEEISLPTSFSFGGRVGQTTTSVVFIPCKNY